MELGALAAGHGSGLGAETQMMFCLGFAWAGLGASVLHLSRPLYAYRAHRFEAFLAQPRGARIRAFRQPRPGVRGPGCDLTGLVCSRAGRASGLARPGCRDGLRGRGLFGAGVPRCTAAAAVLALAASIAGEMA